MLPDRSSLLKGQNLVENAKIQKFKCDILGDFPTLCSGLKIVQLSRFYSCQKMEFMSTDFEFLPLKATIISPSPSPISFFGYKNGIKDARLHTVAKSEFLFIKSNSQ